ncbi:MAG TPA: hypothetical protein VM674_05745 [Candidatus Acidoferrum sp.]|nr:hypothetical protein [Candidatus Acidoferrum sp.]
MDEGEIELRNVTYGLSSPGATISVMQLSRLGHAWYADRLAPRLAAAFA